MPFGLTGRALIANKACSYGKGRMARMARGNEAVLLAKHRNHSQGKYIDEKENKSLLLT
jgi:hypothetical protein